MGELLTLAEAVKHMVATADWARKRGWWRSECLVLGDNLKIYRYVPGFHPGSGFTTGPAVGVDLMPTVDDVTEPIWEVYTPLDEDRASLSNLWTPEKARKRREEVKRG